MKKIVLFISIVALAVSLNSCSSDGSGNGDTVSFKVNGVQKNFNVNTEEDTGYLFVTGHGTADNSNESIELSIYPASDSNVNPIEHFYYSKPDEVNGSYIIISNLTSRTSHSASGTFSGSITGSSNSEDLIITEGIFSLSANR
ncbi:hypothetical protein L1S35_06375 [Flavobacterium sp. AS60]|uniref:hypothetical protein n=1 Tax=Flavobacterium anseongense TaxID=2910677 RepID=UPI001F3AC6A0|nr:hypothetical protein [Flavobacterium sp. AS60]MCF6129292.1 hypothetical protein [Flavobacterium sp. AS60]